MFVVILVEICSMISFMYFFIFFFAGEPLELMSQYFVKFGDKPCCITDLKVFLDLIVRDQHVQVITLSQDCIMRYTSLFLVAGV